jgi:hypothetical protein
MRRTRLAWLALAAVLAAAALGPAAFAGLSDQPDSGEPPLGVAFQSDAQGTKLNGVIAIELLAIEITLPSTRIATEGARAVLRLHKGNEGPRGFFTALAGPIDVSTPDDIAALQADLLDAFRNAILSGAIGFFGEKCGLAGTDCPNVTITPKRIDESVSVETLDGSDSLYFVSDVELAVK